MSTRGGAARHADGSRKLIDAAAGPGVSSAPARIQNESCSLIDPIAGIRKLYGNPPVDRVTNPQSRRILYMREWREGGL
jgi:hypothetical protein